VLPDGNRRWAKARGLSPAEGHKRGLGIFKNMISWVSEAGIPHLVIYAFSTENWKRSSEEVAHLMELFKTGLKELEGEIPDSAAIKFVGDRASVEKDLLAAMAEIESKNPIEPVFTVWLAFSYGGRAEIIAAVNKAVAEGSRVSEESFAALMWSKGMPDPDLIIRTSGEKRLSNFLPWQSIYSELFFTDTYWPDFSKAEFQGILEAYGKRTRRRGL
jgi:undecaprenyl diphosphate synthase